MTTIMQPAQGAVKKAMSKKDKLKAMKQGKKLR